MTKIYEPTYENSKQDASLSCVIGGATGFFVGTDAAYLPDQNFLINLVGIQDSTPDLVGIARSSTPLGFMASQSANHSSTLFILPENVGNDLGTRKHHEHKKEIYSWKVLE